MNYTDFIHLKESYAMMLPGGLAVYKNPSKSDLSKLHRELIKVTRETEYKKDDNEVRFVGVAETQDFYVWDAERIHVYVVGRLIYNGIIPDTTSSFEDFQFFFPGTAIYLEGELYYASSDELDGLVRKYSDPRRIETDRYHSDEINLLETKGEKIVDQYRFLERWLKGFNDRTNPLAKLNRLVQDYCALHPDNTIKRIRK